MKIFDVKVNGLCNPVGFQLEEISFSWKVKDTRDKFQTSARIVVYKSYSGKNILYDTKYTNLNSLGTHIDLQLESKTRYYYQIFVKGDTESGKSEIQYFETAKDDSWHADFITFKNISHRKVVLDFTCRSHVKRARIYICGVGLYEAYLNKEFVNKEYLMPGFHCYDSYLQYQTYDVTNNLLRQNHLEVFLGNGWYKGRFGFDGGFVNLYGDKLALIFEIHIEYLDGSSEIICSDKSCKSQISPIIKDGIYDGELYDARKIESRIYEDMEYVNIDKTKLRPRISLPIIEKERKIAVKKIISKKGEVILDFGQNLTGWIEMAIDCDVKLTFGEILQDGCFSNENYRTALFGYQYISDGIRRVVRPHFTYYGFRYVKVECANDIIVKNYQACVITSEMDQIGFIETGNQKVNQLVSNAYWSQIDNFLDLPTDCPQRDERLGWSGDAQIFCGTACFNSDVEAFYFKYLYDMKCEQLQNDGGMPNVIPTLKPHIKNYVGKENIQKGIEVIERMKHIDLSPWADAAAIIPWTVYRSSGDINFLKKTYSNMKLWVDHAIEKNAMTGSSCLVDSGFHFADWLALDNPNVGPMGLTDMHYVASVFYYYSTKLMADAAKILDKDERVFYEEQANKIKESIYNKYFVDDILLIETQTGYVLALEFNLVKETMRTYHVKKLVKKIKNNNNHMDTGFIGTPFLNKVLSKEGYVKLAYDLLLNEEYPGWLYAVNLGATTIWERWDSVKENGKLNVEEMNSLNHYAYGAIVEWIYRYVCGIEEISAGFKKVRIKPLIDQRLGCVCLKYKAKAGLYSIQWKVDNNKKVIINIDIPFDCTAQVVLPNGEAIYIEAGKHQFSTMLID